jgi:hypothetical protein
MKTPLVWIPALALAWSATGLMAATPAAGTTPAATKTTTTAAAPAPGSTAPAPKAVTGLADMDTNRDNLVSPEEMEAFLKANPGPQRPRS